MTVFLMKKEESRKDTLKRDEEDFTRRDEKDPV